MSIVGDVVGLAYVVVTGLSYHAGYHTLLITRYYEHAIWLITRYHGYGGNDLSAIRRLARCYDINTTIPSKSERRSLPLPSPLRRHIASGIGLLRCQQAIPLLIMIPILLIIC